MADYQAPRARHGEAFWRAHHEAWKRSDLNQREYCAAQRIPLKAFGNWRAKFTAEPGVPVRKLLYRRGDLSHTLSHRLSHTFSHTLSHTPGHMAYPSLSPDPLPIVPPAQAGHRRKFSQSDRRHILAEADEPGVGVSEVARRYGIARRVICRWRQELAAATPAFVTVEIIDAPDDQAEALP
jgi:Transposase